MCLRVWRGIQALTHQCQLVKQWVCGDVSKSVFAGTARESWCDTEMLDTQMLHTLQHTAIHCNMSLTPSYSNTKQTSLTINLPQILASPTCMLYSCLFFLCQSIHTRAHPRLFENGLGRSLESRLGWLDSLQVSRAKTSIRLYHLNLKLVDLLGLLSFFIELLT